MDLVLEFMAYIDREPNADTHRLFERILEKSRLLTGAEARTIFLAKGTQTLASIERTAGVLKTALDRLVETAAARG